MLCRRLVSLNEEFISHKCPSAGFDFTSGKRIEQKLVDYNQEAERFGGNVPHFWLNPRTFLVKDWVHGALTCLWTLLTCKWRMKRMSAFVPTSFAVVLL